MNIWGKIIGGAAGFALGGPLGALLGAAAGHAVDSFRSATAGPAPADGREPAGDPKAATRQVAFTIAVIALGAKMAKADGVVTRDEVDAFKRVFRVPARDMKTVARVFDQARRGTDGFEVYARQVAGLFHRNHAVLEDLLDGLFHIAQSDGKVTDDEIDYLRRVAEIFGFGDRDFERIRASNLGPDKSDPYHVLGIDRDHSNAEIKAAYRKLIRDHHPDRLIAKGVPKEFIDLATEKMQTINAAYDKVARERGIK